MNCAKFNKRGAHHFINLAHSCHLLNVKGLSHEDIPCPCALLGHMDIIEGSPPCLGPPSMSQNGEVHCMKSSLLGRFELVLHGRPFI